MPSVLITDFMGDDTALEKELFSRAGHELHVASSPEPEEWMEVAIRVDAILTRHAPLRASTIDRLKRCRIIARYGSGHDNIDVDQATANGIVVTNVPGYSSEEVADHTVALLLASARHLPSYMACVREGGWTPRPLPPVLRIRGRRLALLGFGRIGRAVAQRMIAFGVEIVVYDPFATELPEGVLRAPSIHELVHDADFLSLHAPLTAQTHGCIDAARIAALKRGAIVVNVARGGLLDLPAAIDALTSGQLGGLAVDVVDEEPLPDGHPLRSLERAIVTPHVAYFSQASVEEAKRRSVEEILAVLDGRPPLHAIAAPASARSHLSTHTRPGNQQ